MDVIKLFRHTVELRPELAQMVCGTRLQLFVKSERDPSDILVILDHLPHLHTLLVTTPLGDKKCPEWIPRNTLDVVDFSFERTISAQMFAQHPRLRHLLMYGIDYENWSTLEGYPGLISFVYVPDLQ